MTEAGRNGDGKRATGPVISAVPFRSYWWLLIAAWTLAAGVSLVWNLKHNQAEALALRTRTAQALLEKDLLYREWSMLRGGVYIQDESGMAPGTNELSGERVILTPSGRRLSLLNPVVVSRQIFQLQNPEKGIRGRVTSLEPIRAENRPDDWERRALEAFAAGTQEARGVETRDGETYFRLMRPLVVVPGCLQCHEEQGRKPGEIRGGIGVMVPMKQFAARAENLHLVSAHLGLWALGITGLVVGLRKLEHHSLKRELAEEQTRAALGEKEALLQEIHHRVKNNLQIISSLLQLQSNEIKEPHTRTVFKESQLRIRSMALIHEKLYESDSLAKIDLADYLRSLAQLLFAAYAKGGNRVQLTLDLAPAPVSIDSAIPLGLIANELLTNALKFAFPDGRSGTIRVELDSTPDGLIEFTVADDGVGLPPGFVLEESKSLGLRLVRMLAQQLEAEVGSEPVGSGTRLSLRFRDRVGGKSGAGQSPARAAAGDQEEKQSLESMRN